MDAGQIMMQTPGIAPTISAPASSETAAAPAGEPSGSTFAGMLRGMSPLLSGTTSAAADEAKKEMPATTDSNEKTTVQKPADVNTDIMAALLAMVGTRDKMATATTGVNSGDKSDKPEKRMESAQPDALMPQDVALFAAGTQIVLSAGGNGRMPESGQKVELQDKPEKPADPAQPDALIPQDVASQIVLSAGGNGRMPESVQKAEPQDDDRSLLQRSVGFAGAVAMPAKQEQPVESSQSAQTTQKADSMLNSETTAGKIDATDFPKVVTKEGGRDMLEKSVPVASDSAGAKMETAVRSAEETPVVQRPVEEKSTLLTAATAANGMAANEMPAVQAGRSQEVHPAQADANKQMDIPVDVGVVKASATVHLNPATVVLEAVGRKMEGQENGAPVQLDTATIKKNNESLSADLTKISATSSPEKELLNEGGKDTSDNGTNGQFQQPTTHQQAKADMGTSLGNISGTVQRDASHSDLSENVLRQVKEVLVNREVKAGGEQITVRLSPEHLGELTINFKMENQQLKVEILAANRGVRDALIQHAENLKESLSRQNITMESFDVATSGGQRGFEQNDRGWKQLAQQQFMAGTSAGGYRYHVPEVDAAVVPQYGMQKQYAMVDVHY